MVIKIRASLRILAFIVEHSVALSFCINSKLFIIELCSPGDRKVLNQHVPLTETKLLIFPELPPPTPLQISPTEEDLLLPLLHNPYPVCERVVRICVWDIMYLSILPDFVTRVKEYTVLVFCKAEQ